MLHAEVQQSRAGCCRAEHAERGGGMPAFAVVVHIHRTADARLRFKAGDVGEQQCWAAGAERFAQRDDCRQNRRRGMAADGVVDVVIVECVAGGAVDQGCIEGARAARGAPQQSRSRATVGRGYRPGDARRGFTGAGERTGKGVDDGDLAPAQGFRWQIRVMHGANTLCNIEGYSHKIIVRCL